MQLQLDFKTLACALKRVVSSQVGEGHGSTDGIELQHPLDLLSSISTLCRTKYKTYIVWQQTQECVVMQDQQDLDAHPGHLIEQPDVDQHNEEKKHLLGC